jgi:hypothetical protein
MAISILARHNCGRPFADGSDSIPPILNYGKQYENRAGDICRGMLLGC